MPGGRIVAPLGNQFPAGAGAFGIAVSASGRTIVTANGGPGVNSLTVAERDRSGKLNIRQIRTGRAPDDDPADDDWKGVAMGLAFSNEHSVYTSEGNSGRVSLFDWNSGRRRGINLNQKGYDHSYSGDLAFDSERDILYVVDQANFRVAVVDAAKRQVITSVRTGRLPFAVALSPDRQTLYVTNLGTFEYRVIPGAAPERAAAAGLLFPAFGFPSAEASSGAARQTPSGSVDVPGLGDPNVEQANSVCVIDVRAPANSSIRAFVRTGQPVGEASAGGSSPSAVLAAGGRVFVSNSSNDSISVIDPATNQVEAEIPIRIPGLEGLRGVLPAGMAYHAATGWLFVAEAGINAVGVIDPRTRRVLGHLPTAWFPTRVAVHENTVYIASARGLGTGANARGYAPYEVVRQGSLSAFPVPSESELAGHTSLVLRANGFDIRSEAERPLPPAVKYVVLIVKENRTYDELLGDLSRAANGPAMGAPEVARYGAHGYVDGRGVRLSLKDVTVAPNHRAIARQWTFSDNFYADSDVSTGGHHWLTGVYPNLWTESSMIAAFSDQQKDFRLGEAPGRLSFPGLNASVHPEDLGEAGSIWRHLSRHGISFFSFGEGLELAGATEVTEPGSTSARFLTNMPLPAPLFNNTSHEYPGFNTNIPDQVRAAQFIREVDSRYVKGGEAFPRFVFIHLPNDNLADPRPADGYPYQESFLSDNDYALGRIVEYLSGTPWWKEMAVFVTEASAQGGVDHLDSNRTILLCAGPWVKRNYVSHANTSFPGLLKTIFRLLHVPPLNLFDAAATSLADCFTSEADYAGYKLHSLDARIFDPAAARPATPGSLNPRSSDTKENRRGAPQ